jgi:hypothetical protein
MVTLGYKGGFCGRGGGLVFGEKFSDSFRELSALGCPVVDAFTLEIDAGGVGARVVSADDLNGAAVAGAVLLDNDDAIVGLLTGANAGQTNH